ncbi:retrovirus-related pol polyprotein from transposon TNT 1-94 [Tanacetum coccineum]
MKPKRVKDSMYHKEKMLLCKQAEKGVQLKAEQSDWLADTDEEIDEQELEDFIYREKDSQEVFLNALLGTDSEPLEQVQYDTRYSVFANEIQHSEQSESISNTCVVETVDINVIPDSLDMIFTLHPEPSTPTKVHAEENNDNQADNTEHEFTNPFCTPLKVYAKDEGKVLISKNRLLPPVARLRLVRIFVADAAHKTDSLIQIIQTKFYRLRKALYGLKQAPRAWYDELSNFLMSKGFTKGLQIHQSPKGIFINQAKYALEILKKHGMEKGQSIGTPMAMKPKLDAYLNRKLTTEKHLKEVKRIFRYLRGTINMGLWYPKDSGFELTAFSDADHAGCLDTRKSTSGGMQFLCDKLVSWMSKKQDCTTMSSAEVEYVALSASYAQVIWMRTHLKDYGFNYNKILSYCDSQSAIAISCNPVQNSHTKHIHARYLFYQRIADMFTKALPEDRFQYLVRRIGMRCLTLAELKVLANESA